MRDQDLDSTSPSTRLRRKSILYMDDHLVLARLSCDILELQGYRAVPVSEANEVMMKLKEERFDLVVTDQFHPGPRGTELVKLIHNTFPQLPVVMASGYYAPETCPEDFVACLSKETLFPALVEVIKKHIGEPATPQQSPSAMWILHNQRLQREVVEEIEIIPEVRKPALRKTPSDAYKRRCA